MKLGRVGGLAAVAVASVVGVGAGAGGAASEERPQRVVAEVQSQAGEALGRVVFTGEGGATRVRVELSGLSAGFHGFHVHAGNACTGNFVDSAQGHFNPGSATHGQHAGDMPVLSAGSDGRAAATFLTEHFRVEQIVGRTVIVHAGADNLANVPERYRSTAPDAPATGSDPATLATGDAGGRTGCGVVQSSAAQVGGYRLVQSDGSITSVGAGGATFQGVQASGVVGAAATPSGDGAWLASGDGGVFTAGDAVFEGSLGGVRLAAPIVGIAAAPGDTVAVVRAQSGALLGRVVLSKAGNKTRVRVSLVGLTPGFHGFHVHAGGACGGNFVESAQGHYNPTSTSHGSHAGDMPVLTVGQDGRTEAEFVTAHFGVEQVVGRAVIVHAAADNLANIPPRYGSNAPDAPSAGPDPATLATGDSGGRVGCGVLESAGGSARNAYWLVAADGGVFTFGDAGFFGSLGGRPLARPMVGVAATPTGGGYWMVAADGGVFTFGDAGFFGSLGAVRLSSPVVGMAPTPTGRGYWIVGRDGGVFTFGDARFFGSAGSTRLAEPVTSIAVSSLGSGYALTDAGGGVFTYGDADFHGRGRSLTAAILTR